MINFDSLDCIKHLKYTVQKTYKKPKATDAQVETRLYAICALTYLLAMISSNMALQWVAYPTQVIKLKC
jgi:uncharacterized membrane protein YwzB